MTGVVLVQGTAGKTCGSCALWKPIERFEKRYDGNPGRTSRCSSCRNREKAAARKKRTAA